jgi:hypothetical protein
MFRPALSSVRSRALSTRSALLRSDVATSAPAKVEEVVAVEAPKPASSFRSRFTWFLSGVAITAIGFSLVLRNDVLETSTQLRRTIDGIVCVFKHCSFLVISVNSDTELCFVCLSNSASQRCDFARNRDQEASEGSGSGLGGQEVIDPNSINRNYANAPSHIRESHETFHFSSSSRVDNEQG